jgi:hypothetical protein
MNKSDLRRMARYQPNAFALSNADVLAAVEAMTAEAIEVAMRDIKDDLLRRAGNLDRYPFESATMAEAALMAATQLREAAAQADTHPKGGDALAAPALLSGPVGQSPMRPTSSPETIT